ncbi:MAG: hypothetical protein ACI9CV_001239, partial [Ilumatobacter sp.]
RSRRSNMARSVNWLLACLRGGHPIRFAMG